MDTNIVIGIVLGAIALASVIILTVVNRASIERITSQGCRTARETLRDKNNDK